VKPLGGVPPRKKDWHPGSDEKVLDLVHPSLFPLVYGRTRALGKGNGFTTSEKCITRCGEADVLEEQEVSDGRYSADYQWSRCEVDISGDDGRARYGPIERITPSDNTSFTESQATSTTYTQRSINTSIALSKKASLP
jgi:hypothetical protein